jgi:ubiquitin carboxyl-terminal hydrolase 9/24
MNIDCQIRGKSDIHEALATMCEVELMEGDNKVFCDRCKEKTDTVLRTAISELPNVLVLSLKRFDLDYNTFETVKLNSRCAFGQTLNMKQYTLAGVEAAEKSSMEESSVDDTEPMIESGDEAAGTEHTVPLQNLTDIDYEYKLVGVLVHAGVAQGGHYYSFIKDRSPRTLDEADKWYRFDDEDVTSFDPSSIEVECFGGKVKKETKWPNGQVHTVESEQFANALMLFYEKVKPTRAETDTASTDESKENQPMDEDDEVQIETSSGYDVFQSDVRRSNLTLRWQTFLLGSEFQTFMKDLLGLCVSSVSPDSHDMDLSPPASSNSANNANTWRLAVMQLLLSFALDILYHSRDKVAINDWTHRLVEALRLDRDSAKVFIHDVAKRTHRVGPSWLRTYCADCPEDISRISAARVISTGILSCASFVEEQNALREWASAWKSQVEDWDIDSRQRKQTGLLSTRLEGKRGSHEDIDMLENGSASSIGIIISFLNLLLEVSPRTWRYTPELCLLIRDISNAHPDLGGNVVRDALSSAEIPARLMSFALRDRAPSILKSAFPGASVSFEVAETIVKTETTPMAHLPMVASANSLGTGVTTGANSTVPCPSDYLNLLEALASIIGVDSMTRTILVVDTGEVSKGRPITILSQAAAAALAVIFDESKSDSIPGMGQRDIQKYMIRCGVDASSVPPQKILSILNKYHTISAGNGAEGRYLSLEGFLTYYRDTALTSESQVSASCRFIVSKHISQNVDKRPSFCSYFFSCPSEFVCLGTI